MELESLKKTYSLLAKKHNLPGFSELNENFEIDKIDKETDLPLRVIRKVMLEKLINSLNFLDLLLNPVNAPRMYLSFIKSMTLEDKKNIEDIYTALSNVSIASIDLEIDYSEKKEAETIKNVAIVWQETKPKFRKILASMKKPNNVSVKKEKSYFG